MTDGLDSVIHRCQKNVPSPPLRHTELHEAKHIASDRIPGGLKDLGRAFHDPALVMLHGGDILDYDESRPKHLHGAHCPQVQGVAGILTPGVVVEVRMPLTRRPGDKNVDFTCRQGQCSSPRL